MFQYILLEIGTRAVVNTRNKGVLTKLCYWIKVAMVSRVKLAILGSTPSGTPGTLLIGVAGDTCTIEEQIIIISPPVTINPIN